MKKLFVVLLSFCAITVQAQVAYYDALKLKRHMVDSDNLDPSSDTAFSILDNYIDPLVQNTRPQILAAIRETSGSPDPNPFLEMSGSIQSGREGEPPRLKNLISAAGDLNVTNLADGLAQFLIERSKEELSVAFFDGLKRDLAKFPELQVLFPTTASFIGNIEAYNYASFIQTLREAFQADLMTLPSGFRNLRDLRTADCQDEDGKCKARIQQLVDFFNTNEKSILFIASTIVMDSLQAGGSIADILQAVAEDDQLSKFPESNISNALILADIFSGSLRTINKDRVFITKEELKKLSDPVTLKLYFGLIYQQCKNKNIRFKSANASVVLTSLLKPEDVRKYFGYLDKITSSGAEINRLIGEIREKKVNLEKFSIDDYVQYVNASVDVIHSLLDWEVFQVPHTAETGNIMTIARSSISVYYNIRSANYSSAIGNAFIILDKTMNDQYSHREKVLRYGSFMASVVQAENAGDVKKAIEAVALPAGSASIKKNSQWSIGLNAYLGAFTGREYLADKKTDKWKNTAGLSAPIGIAVSHRAWSGSVTGFISIIDIGTVVSYRLEDNTTSELPRLTLQNIFAPGFGFIIGIPKVPISIGYMSQLGPALREIDSAAATVTDKLNHRHFVFLAVDIPLVNFYTRPKDK